MGGMAAQIPIKDDPVANGQAIAKVRADKGEVGESTVLGWLTRAGGRGNGGVRCTHVLSESNLSRHPELQVTADDLSRFLRRHYSPGPAHQRGSGLYPKPGSAVTAACRSST